MDLDEQELKATRALKAINKIVAGDEKTADEMFEELGYKKIKDDSRYLVYELNYITEIEFSLITNRVIADGWLTGQELKVINKKCEELGWL